MTRGRRREDADTAIHAEPTREIPDEQRPERPRSALRHTDRWAATVIIILAIAAGLTAAYFGEPKSWEQQTPSSVSQVQSQGSP
jgi:hypothetical protein